jgi:leucyl aminopeptidase (aminopeptidase T)
MQRVCRTIASKLESARDLTLKTRDGSTLTMRSQDRAAKQITGRAVAPGSFSQIGGVVGVAPIEGTASGAVRAVGSVKIGTPGENLLTTPLDLVIENGRISSMSGERADDVRTYLAAHNDERMNQLGVVGLGLHPAARLCGQFGEDERVAGLVHLSFGTNTYHGGTIEAKGRLDICLQPATLELDGKQLEETLWL